uniref:Metallophosphoesterase domain containing 2 n=1 Tax=Bos indicus x Bos taurus TaxID=30522 RepID=A0A4W2HIZ0_BOBOX
MAHGIPSQGKVTITVDEYSSNPTQAFTHYNINQSRFQPPHVHMVDPIPYDTPKPAGHTRFVCISDTHSRTDGIQMPYGDILLHTGDFTELGLPSEVKKFNDWLDHSISFLVSSHLWNICDSLLLEYASLPLEATQMEISSFDCTPTFQLHPH